MTEVEVMGYAASYNVCQFAKQTAQSEDVES
jgi:hypothetical protein